MVSGGGDADERRCGRLLLRRRRRSLFNAFLLLLLRFTLFPLFGRKEIAFETVVQTKLILMIL